MKTQALLLALLVCLSSAHAYSERGMKTYQKLCKSCHGSEFRGAAMLTMGEWEEVFENDDKGMIERHKESPEGLATIERSYYQNRKKYLIKFLVRNAKDSGVVPGCDGNYCGY
jgi:hypothetical protein